MHRHRKQLTGRLESCWQDHAPWADSPTHPITKHVISKMQPQLRYRSQTNGGNIAIQLWLAHKWLSNVLWIERRIVRMLKTDLMSISGFSNCLIHCVMWTAGNGITFVEGREDNTVTPDNSLATERKQTLSGHLSISFQLQTTNNILYQSFFAFCSRPSLKKASSWWSPPRVCVACMLHWFGRFLLIHFSYYAASISDLFWCAHLARRTAVWRSTPPVISYRYSWLKFHQLLLYIIDWF